MLWLSEALIVWMWVKVCLSTCLSKDSDVSEGTSDSCLAGLAAVCQNITTATEHCRINYSSPEISQHFCASISLSWKWMGFLNGVLVRFLEMRSVVDFHIHFSWSPEDVSLSLCWSPDFFFSITAIKSFNLSQDNLNIDCIDLHEIWHRHSQFPEDVS